MFHVGPWKVIVFAWLLPSAVAIAAASEPEPEEPLLVTAKDASNRRSSSANTTGLRASQPCDPDRPRAQITNPVADSP